jgi:ABC-type xylose transport system substrate-binding protein
LLKFFKNNWVLVLALFLLLIMSLPLLYFGNLMKILNRQNEDVYSATDSKKPTVGVCLNNLVEARWMKEQAMILEEAKNQGLSIRLKVAHHSLARQVEQITNLIAHHVKVLIINPVSREGLDVVLEEAHRQGIKIIQYDELTTGPVDLFLGVDYREMGRIQATSLLEKAGAGNYLIFRGPKDSYRGEMLYSGQHEIFKLKNNNKLNILAVNTLISWSADEAVNKIRATIFRQKLHGILAPNDLIAEEIIKFFKEQKVALPYITGAGAELNACQRILQDEQLITVYFNYQLMAKTAVISAKEFLMNKNSPVPSTVISGSRKVPANIFPVYQITKSNLKSLLHDKMKIYTSQDLNLE